MKVKKTDLKQVSAILLLTYLATHSAYAGNTRETDFGHTLELSFFAGELNVDFAEQDFNEDEAKHYQFTYDYQFKGGFYLGAGYLNGESGDWSPIDDLFGGDEMVYEAALIKAGYRHFLSSKQALYAEISALNYDVNLTLGRESAVSDDGMGWGFALGWQYRLDNGIGFKLGLDVLQFGSDVGIQTVRSGISYRF